MSKRKIRVGILFGGRSGEHEVSLISAQGIIKAIDKEKYEVVPIGITKEGRWLVGGDPLRALRTAADLPPLLGDEGKETPQTVLVPMEPGPNALTRAGAPLEIDVIFPVLHGPYGEDGTVQGLLELTGLPYVGAGVAASAVGMDKAIAKDVFRSHGLPVLPYLVILRKTWEADASRVIADCEATLEYPMFTKPANLGSSVGVSKAHNREELAVGLEHAARFDRKLIVEQGIPAREIEVSVLGNDDPIASLPGEIIPSREFYSYAAKYIDDASELLIPAPLSEEQTGQVRRLAIQAYTAIDCAGMARVDFLLDKESQQLWLNELNTIPGFTPISMYPKLWEASGISYADLIDRLIELALERHQDKGRSSTSFDVSRAT
ncbi:MAG: D-alanine--D-alanine ligase family protein [Anaerolineae bacterium]